jgi:hypothetical protein
MPSPMGALSKGRESVYKSKRKRSIDILNSLFETLYQFSFNHKEGACVTSFEGWIIKKNDHKDILEMARTQRRMTTQLRYFIQNEIVSK